MASGLHDGTDLSLEGGVDARQQLVSWLNEPQQSVAHLADSFNLIGLLLAVTDEFDATEQNGRSILFFLVNSFVSCLLLNPIRVVCMCGWEGGGMCVCVWGGGWMCVCVWVGGWVGGWGDVCSVSKSSDHFNNQ